MIFSLVTWKATCQVSPNNRLRFLMLPPRYFFVHFQFHKSLLEVKAFYRPKLNFGSEKSSKYCHSQWFTLMTQYCIYSLSCQSPLMLHIKTKGKRTEILPCKTKAFPLHQLICVTDLFGQTGLSSCICFVTLWKLKPNILKKKNYLLYAIRLQAKKEWLYEVYTHK